MELGRRKPEYFRSDFEQAVFEAAYESRQQRAWRRVALIVLGFKHGIRGLLFSWPAYVLALAIAHSGSFHAMAYLIMLVPAVFLSCYLLLKGVRDDYSVSVENVLLQKGFVRQLLWRSAPQV
jgi:hypothetical protein